MVKRPPVREVLEDEDFVYGGERGETMEVVPKKRGVRKKPVEPEPAPKKVAPRQKAHFKPGRAPARAAAHVDDHDPARVRIRHNKATFNNNPHDIPTDEIPEGWSYEWKRWAVGGKHDPYYIAAMRHQGWEFVPSSRHPNWVPPGYKEPHIIKGDLVLMDRPEELTEEARREIRQMSKRQIREAEQRLGKTGEGQAERVKPTVVKEMMRPMVVEE